MRLPVSWTSLIILLSATAPLANAAEPALTDDSKCGCYLMKGNDTSYFRNHRFFDFRDHAHHSGVPPAIREMDKTASAPPTSPYFTSPEFRDFWYLSVWDNSNGARPDATVKMVNSPNNVYLEGNSDPNPSPKSWLTLRTQRLQGFQTAAEIASNSSDFLYLSMRMMARTTGSPGALTAMFTYRHSDELAKVQESDLEVRTSDPKNIVHYTNQPSYTDDGELVPNATKNATMPNGLKWSDWAVHRLDWAPKSTTWYVNDVQVAQIEFQTPREPSNILLNAWSDGGKWTGNMTLWDAAYLQLQWFEIVYNTTEPAQEREENNKGCQAVCSIDSTRQLGKPVMLWNNGAARILQAGGGLGIWLPLAMGVLFLVA
ncbi:family 16 putative glycoside hydrolase [Podospora australis]|uniref:Family 16 putative glycoside hydrolase n=1 Tax=Podospora australis TaxID=1536484 RepID=A0AAN6WQY2_9PEZI|nr:family 16 putative glycoside hydrolase [Podospora australis]